jgi:hypothetical protein
LGVRVTRVDASWLASNSVASTLRVTASDVRPHQTSVRRLHHREGPRHSTYDCDAETVRQALKRAGDRLPVRGQRP